MKAAISNEIGFGDVSIDAWNSVDWSILKTVLFIEERICVIRSETIKNPALMPSVPF
jgi:hypothetical protein